MAVLKLSQINPAGIPPASTDTVVGVQGGATDLQYTLAQLQSTILNSSNGTSIALTGDVTGSGGPSIATTLKTVNSNVGTFSGITVNAKGLVTAASSQGYLTGNQAITLSGDTTGSGTTAITTTLATVNSNVGTFQGITVNAKGLVTAASSQGYATLASPTFTGTPAAPTATAGTNTTQLATTAFVQSAIGTPGIIPENSQSANYTTVLADAGKFLYHPASDANARTFTIDSNANVAFSLGTVISFVNLSANALTIAITADTMYLMGTGTTGSRTLAQYGSCTALKTDTTTWVISGTNLT